VHENASRGDFAANAHLLRITAIAIVTGALSTITAYVLLHLINFFTNLFFFQSLSFISRSPAGNTLGLWVIVIPVIGGLMIGLIARYGSEAIRGHGIPEAIEAILFGKSKMSPTVAMLKPLSSAIAIGSGGPFGAEGPIIMTGGALGSLLAQYFHLTAGERTGSPGHASPDSCRVDMAGLRMVHGNARSLTSQVAPLSFEPATSVSPRLRMAGNDTSKERTWAVWKRSGFSCA
jgi:hypothetical protein